MAIGVDQHSICALILFGFLTTGVYSSSATDNSDGSDGSGVPSLQLGLVVGGVVSVVVLVVVIALCTERRIHVELMDKGPPYWAHSLEFKQEYNGGLSSVSEGMNNLSPFHVIRERLGQAMTDGARWDVGFVEGKHVFEVVWPIKKNRGSNSSIGVGTQDVPLKKQGRLALAGHHSQSWGFNLSSRKMVHANKLTGSFQKQVPDRFFLYVDMDSGKLGFGEDVKQLGGEALFYGYLVNGIKMDKNVPKYLMVGMCAPREEVQIYYIGTAIAQGGFDLLPPPPAPGTSVVYGKAGQQPMGDQQPIDQKQEEVKVQMGEPTPSAAVY